MILKSLVLMFVFVSISKVSANSCEDLVDFRDGELFKLMEKSTVDFNDRKLDLYIELKNDLNEEIQNLRDNEPWVGANGAKMLRLTESLSTRFIDLTAAVVPGGATKAIGFGYASLKTIAKGEGTDELILLVGKERITKGLSEAVKGPLEIAISTGNLVKDLSSLEHNYKADAAAIEEVKSIIKSIEAQVKKYDELINEHKDSKYNFMYLNNLKNWIDETCNNWGKGQH